jgi:polyisoprenoid-binding protein YceI
MMRLIAGAVAAALGAGGLAWAEPVEFKFDTSHGDITFEVMHLGFSATHGRFNEFSGKLILDEKLPGASSVSVSIPTWSVDTNWQPRDKHLRSADFFNVEKFPAMTFESTNVRVKKDGNRADVTGNLTLLGVTKPVVLDVTMNFMGPHPRGGSTAAGFTATTKINRKDFGMTFGEGAVGDEVSIKIDVEALAPVRN